MLGRMSHSPRRLLTSFQKVPPRQKSRPRGPTQIRVALRLSCNLFPRTHIIQRSDLAGEEVEKCQQRLTDVTARLLREHARVSRERKSELKDILFVWTQVKS